jgi:hypothetical protein
MQARPKLLRVVWQQRLRTYIAWCLATISLPLGAHLYDPTGGYETSVMVAGGANLLAVLVTLTLPRQKRTQ